MTNETTNSRCESQCLTITNKSNYFSTERPQSKSQFNSKRVSNFYASKAREEEEEENYIPTEEDEETMINFSTGSPSNAVLKEKDLNREIS